MNDQNIYSAHGNSAQSIAPPPATLGERLSIVRNRLTSVACFLEEIGDAIYGPTPQAVANGKEARPVSSVMSHVQDLSEVVDRIEGAVARIQNAL